MLDDLYIRGFVLRHDFEEAYLTQIEALKHIHTVEFQSPVTFFVGENGSGKSTLMEAIAVSHGFNPEGGTRNFQFTTKDTHSSLYKQMTLHGGIYRAGEGFFLRAESFYNVSTEVEEIANSGLIPSKRDARLFMERNYGGVLHEQSHGESFWALVTNRFQEGSVFLLDEPEAALSPTRQLALLSVIHRLVEADCQFIIATHSPILMAYPEADILEVSPKGLIKTQYEDTEHYQMTKQFLNNTEGVLRELFRENEKQ